MLQFDDQIETAKMMAPILLPTSEEFVLYLNQHEKVMERLENQLHGLAEQVVRLRQRLDDQEADS